MRYGTIGAAIATLAALLLFPGEMALSGGRGGQVRHAGSMSGGADADKDIAIRQVTVTPARAHVGDTVRVEVVIENKTDGYDTVPLEISANGKVVGRKLFTFGFSPADRIYHESFAWPTGGLSPGEYRIRAEAFVWEDSSPFDNFLEVKQVVLLAAPGTPFPDGAKSGGSATETDPRFVQKARPEKAESKEEPAPAMGGY